MSDSLLKGTKWCWRQGLRQMPIHSSGEKDSNRTRELYLPVSSESKMQQIMDELKANGISVSDKKTHSPYDIIPQGSLILYAATSLENKVPDEEKNMEKLKGYILTHGGSVEGVRQKPSILKAFWANLLGGRK